MCGLIAEFNTKINKTKKPKDANEFIINQFENQYYRGEEGFGIIRINNNQTIEIDRACETTKFLLDLYLKKSNMIIAHHRTPTSTHNKLDQTHPIFVSNKQLKYDYYIIHNGTIALEENNILHKKHLNLNFKYTTEYQTAVYSTPIQKWNDSETIAIELALFIENKITIINITNSAAFIILQINKKTQKTTKILFGKNGINSVLNMNKQKGICQLSSEGNGIPIKEKILYSFKTKDPTMKLTTQKIPFKKEIPYEIPHTNSNIATPFTVPKKTDFTSNNIEPTDTKTLRDYREWITEIEPQTIDYTTLIPIVDKNYIPKTCVNIKKSLTQINNPKNITHIIDDELDSQMQNITEILNEYKEILLTDKLYKLDIEEYEKQIQTILQTMSIITNIAEAEYKKQLTEEEELTIIEKNLEEPFTKQNQNNTCGFLRNEYYDDF